MQDAPRVSWRLVVLCAATLTLLFTIQGVSQQDISSFDVVLRRQVVLWGTWLALTPFVIVVARRYPFGDQGRGRWMARQLLIGGGFAVAHSVIAPMLRYVLGVAGPGAFSVSNDPVDAIVSAFFTQFGRNYLSYAFIAAAYQAVAYHRAVRERDLHAARLEVDLAEAKLATLESRIRPHFLFNTLNTIAGLVREDPAAAEAMIGQLSDLLRASLKADPGREVQLHEELQLAEQYLAIQRARFGDRLRVAVDVSAEARRARVPQLILQPLVENAVRHGIAPRESGGLVWVCAERVGSRLRMTVEDDGVGMGNAPPNQAGGGLGLGGVGSRLSHLYGADHRLDVTARRPTGTRVMIEIPFRVDENGSARPVA